MIVEETINVKIPLTVFNTLRRSVGVVNGQFPPTAALGTQVYNVPDSQTYIFDGSKWLSMAPATPKPFSR